MERLLRNYGAELPKFEVIYPKGNEFQAEQIFFENANLVFYFLGLPSIEDWTEHLKNTSKKSEWQFGRFGGGTLAGLTDDEIRDHIRRWDWSQQPDKRARTNRIHTIKQIMSILKEDEVIPDDE